MLSKEELQKEIEEATKEWMEILKPDKPRDGSIQHVWLEDELNVCISSTDKFIIGEPL